MELCQEISIITITKLLIPDSGQDVDEPGPSQLPSSVFSNIKGIIPSQQPNLSPSGLPNVVWSHG